MEKGVGGVVSRLPSIHGGGCAEVGTTARLSGECCRTGEMARPCQRRPKPEGPVVATRCAKGDGQGSNNTGGAAPGHAALGEVDREVTGGSFRPRRH